jgi:hypothetical protein
MYFDIIFKLLKVSILHIILSLSSLTLSWAQNSLIPYRKGQLWGYCNAEKQIIIPCQYQNAFPFAEGRAMVQLNKKVGFIDEKGEVVIPIQYDYLLDSHFFKNGLVRVRLGSQDDNSTGFVDKNGQIIIPLKHYLLSDFVNGLARAVIISGSELKYGFYNNEGKLVIPFQPYKLSNFDHYGLAYFKRPNSFKTLIMNRLGQILFDSTDYCLEKPFSDSLAVFSQETEHFDSNQQKVKLHKEGYLDLKGRVVIPARFYRAWPFRLGRAVVQESEFSPKFLINKQGQIIHQNGYQDIGIHTSEGLIPVMQNGKYGFIDSTGREVIPIQYDRVNYFGVGSALVEKNQQCWLIDRKGNALSAKFAVNSNEDLGIFYEGMMMIYQKNTEGEGKWGFLNKNFQLAIACKYDNATPFSRGLARVYLKNGDNWQSGYIDKKGTEYWE